MRRSDGQEGSDDVSAFVETKLVDTLFDQPGSIVVGQVAVIGLPLLAYWHNRSPWLIVWAVSMLLVIAPRLWLARGYRKRPASDAPMLWAYRFLIGAEITSLAYGVASAASVLQSDQFLQVIIITGQSAYVSVAAVRNNAVPKVAAAQSVPPLAFLALACLATGNPFYMAYSFLVLLHLLAVIQIIGFMSEKTRNLLIAEERARAANARLEELVTKDPLTGAANRRGFDEAMTKALAQAIRHEEDLSLLLIDIDHFKALNDAYGHQTGDVGLRAVATCLQTTVRPSDVVSRHGGEEFAVLLPATRYTGAACVAERVRIAIKGLAIAHPTSPSGALTVSVGYATFAHEHVADSGALIKHADIALYHAKRLGRNRIAGGAELEASRVSPTEPNAYDPVAI